MSAPSIRLVLQSAMEAEITEFLGRERDARGEGARAGHRNGYSPVTVKTTAGPVTLERGKHYPGAAACVVDDRGTSDVSGDL